MSYRPTNLTELKGAQMEKYLERRHGSTSGTTTPKTRSTSGSSISKSTKQTVPEKGFMANSGAKKREEIAAKKKLIMRPSYIQTW